MNFAHAHLVLTHFPPVLSLAASAWAAVGAIRRRRDLVHVALILMIATGAFMPLVYIAGDRAADTIGKVEGVQQEAIAPHQHAAKFALAISIFAAVVAGGVIVVDRRRDGLALPLMLVVVLVSIGSAATIGWTATLGGAIHHPEAAGRR